MIIEPKYITTDAIESPSLALETVRMELGHLGGLINTMMQAIQPAIADKDHGQVDKIISMDNKVKILVDAILQYLSLLRKEPLTEKESKDFQAMMTATTHMDQISDVISNELSEVAIHYIESEQKPSEITRELLKTYYLDVCLSVQDAVKAISEEDQLTAEKIINRKADIKAYQDDILTRKSSHLGSEEPNYLEKARQEMSLMEKLYRIYSNAKGIAYVVLPVALNKHN